MACLKHMLAASMAIVLFSGAQARSQTVPASYTQEPRNFAEGMGKWASSLQLLLSGFKVDASAIDATGSQKTQMIKAVKEGGVSARIEAEKNLALVNAVNNLSYSSGQGYNVCRAVSSDLVAVDTSSVTDKVRAAARNVDQTWINGDSDAGIFIATTLANRKQYYCSQAEREAGLCTSSGSGGFAAGDSDASVWLSNRSYGSEEVATAADFIDVAAPLPTIVSGNQSTQRTLARIQALRRAALVSGARQSLYGVAISGMEGEGNAGQSN